MTILLIVLAIVAGLAIGAACGFSYHKNSEQKKLAGAMAESERIISDATKKAELAKKDLISEGKEEVHRLR